MRKNYKVETCIGEKNIWSRNKSKTPYIQGVETRLQSRPKINRGIQGNINT